MDIAGAQVALGRARPAVAHRPAPGARRRSRARARASSRCRPACAPPRRARRRSASRTSRAPTASTSPCWRWWRCSPARSWCSRSSSLSVAQAAASSSRCSACSACRRASGSRSCSAESALLGVVGSVLGLALGTALAAMALAPARRRPRRRLLPRRRAGAAVRSRRRRWCTARSASSRRWSAAGCRRARPQRDRAGAGAEGPRREPRRRMRAAGCSASSCWRPASVLALLPPIADLPLAAYASVACLLIGGIACVPGGVGAAARGGAAAAPAARPARRRARAPRARTAPPSPSPASSPASRSSVALTVMVASFREAVSRWLDIVLPADLYVARRDRPRRRRRRDPAAEPARGAPRGLPGVEPRRGAARRARCRSIRAGRRSALIARPLADPARSLPLSGELRRRAAGRDRRLRQRGDGRPLRRRAGDDASRCRCPTARAQPVFVRGVWRDYARQYGAIVIDAARLAAPHRRPAHQRPGALARARRRAGDGRGGPAPRSPASRHDGDAARVRGAARDPRDVAAHLRPQLRRHLLAAGGGDRDRPVRHRRELLGAGAGAAQGVRPARRTSA